jgi:O-antigen ligase
VVLLPILVHGMIDNDRRLVWVQILAALAVFWMISRRSQLKRAVVALALCSLPLLILYVGVGWNSNKSIFKPVQTLRSVGDSDVDASTMYRDLENFNLLQTQKTNLLTGTGFGMPFLEVVKLPDISFFEEYRYMPHNSILGLWAFCGPFGFTALTFALVVAIYLAARSYNLARTSDERIAAFMVIGVITIYMMHCWGDIGFTERKAVYLVGPALALAGQLALATGAWRDRTFRTH